MVREFAGSFFLSLVAIASLLFFFLCAPCLLRAEGLGQKPASGDAVDAGVQRLRSTFKDVGTVRWHEVLRDDSTGEAVSSYDRSVMTFTALQFEGEGCVLRAHMANLTAGKDKPWDITLNLAELDHVEVRPLVASMRNIIGTLRHGGSTVTQVISPASIDVLEIHKVDNTMQILYAPSDRKAAELVEALEQLGDACRSRDGVPAAAVAAGHLNRGNGLMSQKQFDAAMAEYREILRVDPTFKPAVVHNNIATAMFLRGDQDGAIAEMHEALRINPADPEKHNTLGLMFKKKGDLDNAIAEYREAIRLKPKYAEAHDNLGDALDAKGDRDGAVAEYRAAVESDPSYAVGFNDLGVELYKKGDLAGAVEQLKQALRVQPNYTMARKNLEALEQKLQAASQPAPAANPEQAEQQQSDQEQQQRQERISELQSDIEEQQQEADQWEQQAQNLSDNSNCSGPGAALCSGIGTFGAAKARQNAAKARQQMEQDREEIARLQNMPVRHVQVDTSYASALQQQPTPNVMDTAAQQTSQMMAIGAANDAARARAAQRATTSPVAAPAPASPAPTAQPMFAAFSFSTRCLHDQCGDGAWGAAVERDAQDAINQSGDRCAEGTKRSGSCGNGNGGRYAACGADGATRYAALAIYDDGYETFQYGTAVAATSPEAARSGALGMCNHTGCRLVWETPVDCTGGAGLVAGGPGKAGERPCTDMTSAVTAQQKTLTGPGHCSGEAAAFLTNRSSEALWCDVGFYKGGMIDKGGVGGTAIMPGQTVGGEGGGFWECGADVPARAAYYCYPRAQQGSCQENVKW